MIKRSAISCLVISAGCNEVWLFEKKSGPYQCSRRECGYRNVILPMELLPVEVLELTGKMMDRAKAGGAKYRTAKPVLDQSAAAYVWCNAESRSSAHSALVGM